MSAPSGIPVSQELLKVFSSADASTRFIKASIVSESLVHSLSVPSSGGSFLDDLDLLSPVPSAGDDNAFGVCELSQSEPAFIMARLDEGGWLMISYVPESAPVRYKVRILSL